MINRLRCDAGQHVPLTGAPEAPQTDAGAQDCVAYRCRDPALRTNVAVIHEGRRKALVMTLHYSNPALDSELAYRREMLMAAGRGTRTKRGGWFRNRRRPS